MAVQTLTAGLSAALASYSQDAQPQGIEGRLVVQAAWEALRHFKEPASSLLKAADFPHVGTAEWGRMNRKRAELIRKKIRGELSGEERELYETLQRRSLEELERTFRPGGAGGGRDETPESRGEAPQE